MRIHILVAASTVALAASSGVTLAQETMADGLVMVNVAGSMVEVPVSIAAEACGMDAAAVIEAADMMNSDARGADMVAAEPNSDAAAAEPTTEAAVGAGAASTETEAGTATETSTGTATADAGSSADAAGEAGQVPESASAGVAADLAMEAELADGGSEAAAEEDAATTADAGAEAAAGGGAAMPTAVCEIDQATADQHGITAAVGASGG